VNLIDHIAEQKIVDALLKGDLDNLPGQGHPLHLDDDSFVPEELRVAYRVLKNSGFLPPGVNLRKEIAGVNQLLMDTVSEDEQMKLSKRMNYLLMQLGLMNLDSSIFSEEYYLKILNRKHS
jgi:DnaJ homologue, subfamily C, member 28, conserved domain